MNLMQADPTIRWTIEKFKIVLDNDPEKIKGLSPALTALRDDGFIFKENGEHWPTEAGKTVDASTIKHRNTSDTIKKKIVLEFGQGIQAILNDYNHAPASVEEIRGMYLREFLG
jgi:hypothetical protein